MKHLRKLTRTEKVFLKEQGLNPKEFLCERKDFESYTFYYISTGKLVTMRR
ncbi:DUF6906 family protein [Clostridium brassicae]|uniref:DUF6906 family protein n=1 Tax=Clostridium brassicae TaxID=2999072 RepID=UPI00389958D3